VHYLVSLLSEQNFDCMSLEDLNTGHCLQGTGIDDFEAMNGGPLFSQGAVELLTEE
jgi:hypothetical protein